MVQMLGEEQGNKAAQAEHSVGQDYDFGAIHDNNVECECVGADVG